MIREDLIRCYQEPLEYSLNNKNGNRSTARTNIVNANVINLIAKAVGRLVEVEPEVEINCARGESFTIDLVYPKEKVLVLLKSVESSYNKNRHNYTNGMLGEAQRVYGKGNNGMYDDYNLLFVNFLPRVLPVKDKSGFILRYEKVKCCDIEEDLQLINPNIHVLNILLDVDWQNDEVDIPNKDYDATLDKIIDIFQEKHED